jgi:hypothetical protein
MVRTAAAGALVALVAGTLIGALAGGGGGSSGDHLSGHADDVAVADATPPGEQTLLRHCAPGPQGGGSGVWIKGISCEEVRDTLVWLGGSGTIQRRWRHGFIRTQDGWECWGRKEGRFSPIHNVCFRDEQLVIFYVN